MGSHPGDWPSYNPHNFSQLRATDPSLPTSDDNVDHEVIAVLTKEVIGAMGHFERRAKCTLTPLKRYKNPASAKKSTPTTYHPTHNRTAPPPNQVITTEATNILLRQFYQRADTKLRPKRAASENLIPEHGSKQHRGSSGDASK